MPLRIRTGLASLAALLLPLPVFAASALERLDKVGGVAFPGQRERQAPEVVGQIINVFLGVLGVLFVVLLVYGGYLWMNARGNEQQVEKAKSLITQAVIGLTVMLAAYAISNFVVTELVNATGYGGGAAPAGGS